MFPACIRYGSNKQDCPIHTPEQSCQTQELKQKGTVAFAPSFLSLSVALVVPVESVGTGALRVLQAGTQGVRAWKLPGPVRFHGLSWNVPEQESEAQVIFFSGLFLRRTALSCLSAKAPSSPLFSPHGTLSSLSPRIKNHLQKVTHGTIFKLTLIMFCCPNTVHADAT